MIRILNYTDLHPMLTPEPPEPPLAYLLNGKGTGPEALIEYAARVCYKSVGNMGTNPTFIKGCIGRGHEDIIEHIFASLLTPCDHPLVYTLSTHMNAWLDPNRFIVVPTRQPYRNHLLMTANLRTWLSVLSRLFNMAEDVYVLELFRRLAPQIFGSASQELELPKRTLTTTETYFLADEAPCAGVARQRVSLIGISVNGMHELQEANLSHLSATFLVEGISRACSHQLVRHRLLCFSQESQRYVSLTKGGWQCVLPPHLYEASPDRDMFLARYEEALNGYRELRQLELLKEDARLLLNNACETTLVMSGPLEVFDHFAKLRSAKDAQWEIRGVSNKICKLLVSMGIHHFEKYLL